jgi:site-specific recombinase XerD
LPLKDVDVEESIVTFLFHLRAQGSTPATLVWYRGRLVQCAHFFRSRPVGEMDRDGLLRYVARLGDRLSPATVKGHLRAINRFLGWCVEEGMLAENPASAL